jgi:hypothetical protein
METFKASLKRSLSCRSYSERSTPSCPKQGAWKLLILGSLAMNSSLFLSQAHAAVTFDAVDSYTSSGQSVAAVTLAHSISGSNTLLLMQSQIATVPSTAAVTFVTFNSIPLTRIRRDTSKDINQSLETWYLTAPPSGPGTLVVMWGGTRKAHIAVLSYQGVDPASPIGTTAFKSFGVYSTSIGISLVTSTDNSVIAALAALRTSAAITPGPGQVQRWVQPDRQSGEGDDKPTAAAGAYGMTYSFGASVRSAVQAFEIHPYIPSTPTPTTTASNTPTVTSTSTATATPTITATGTSSPTPTPSLPVWPNPFTPSLGTNNRVHFGMPSTHGPGEFIIMTLHQRPIRDLKFDAGAEVTWDGKDASGQVVPGGLYLYLLKVDTQARRGTFAVLR